LATKIPQDQESAEKLGQENGLKFWEEAIPNTNISLLYQG